MRFPLLFSLPSPPPAGLAGIGKTDPLPPKAYAMQRRQGERLCLRNYVGALDPRKL